MSNLAAFEKLPLIVIVDDSQFASQNMTNFLWVAFTRSNPAVDIHGLGSSLVHKHFACQTLVIDARTKPHHAPGLMEDPVVTAKVDARAARGDQLAKYL